jgi:hypothetical protein
MAGQNMEGRLTARVIIQELIRNMNEGLEPFDDVTLAPGVYHIYLHPEDFTRLNVVADTFREQAERALKRRLAELNAKARPGKVKIPFANKPQPMEYKTAGDFWIIELREDLNEELEVGDVEVVSQLALPRRQQSGSGTETKKIATRRSSNQVKTDYETIPRPPAEPSFEPEQSAYARIVYQDNHGSHTFLMKKDQIKIGRGGKSHLVHLQLITAADVSRTHIVIRRDPQTDQFFIKDLSRYGTKVDGVRVTPSHNEKDLENENIDLDQTPDLEIWESLPDRARINLADVIDLKFEALSGGGK